MLYDLLVIGDEREGVGRAIAAARLGRRVAVISDPETSPSLKLLMDAVENLSINGRLAAAEGRDPSFARRAILVSSRLAKLRVSTMTAWRTEVERLWQRQISADHSQMDSLAIDRISGNAEFVSQMSVRITGCCSPQVVSGTEIVVSLRRTASSCCRIVIATDIRSEVDDRRRCWGNRFCCGGPAGKARV